MKLKEKREWLKKFYQIKDSKDPDFMLAEVKKIFELGNKNKEVYEAFFVHTEEKTLNNFLGKPYKKDNDFQYKVVSLKYSFFYETIRKFTELANPKQSTQLCEFIFDNDLTRYFERLFGCIKNKEKSRNAVIALYLTKINDDKLLPLGGITLHYLGQSQISSILETCTILERKNVLNQFFQNAKNDAAQITNKGVLRTIAAHFETLCDTFKEKKTSVELFNEFGFVHLAAQLFPYLSHEMQIEILNNKNVKFSDKEYLTILKNGQFELDVLNLISRKYPYRTSDNPQRP